MLGFRDVILDDLERVNWRDDGSRVGDEAGLNEQGDLKVRVASTFLECGRRRG